MNTAADPTNDAGDRITTVDALTRIGEVLDHIDHSARATLDAPARVGLVTAIVSLCRRTDALRAVLVSEAERARAAESTHGASLRSLLATQAQVTPGEAATWVYAGRDITTHDAIREAALAGDVSVNQARAIDTVLGELPATLTADQRAHAKQALLERARVMDAKALSGQSRAILEEVAPEHDAAEDELQRLDTQRRQAHAARTLTFVPDGRGSVIIRGQLPVLDAAPFERLVQAYTTTRLSREHPADHPGTEPDTRTPAQRRADALTALIAAHATAVAGPRPRAGGEDASREQNGNRGRNGNRLPRLAGDRPRVHVTMSYDHLHAEAEQAGVLPDGARITASELRRLACDADIVPVVLGGASEVLDVGREARLVTPEIRRALTLRDGGCTFPGCNAPAGGCEAHHIIPWWAGGATCLANLVLLCPHHHGTIEPLRFWSNTSSGPPRWRVRIADDGHPEFLPPTSPGTNPTPQRHQRTLQKTSNTAATPCPPGEPCPERSASSVRRVSEATSGHDPGGE